MNPSYNRPASAAVASPCISVCAMDSATGLCAGCQRTLDEIARWGGMDNDQRRDVLATVQARRAAQAAGEAVGPAAGNAPGTGSRHAPRRYSR